MQEIVIITQYFYPDIASTAQLMTDLAQGLASRNYQVKVFTSSKSGKFNFNDNFLKKVKVIQWKSNIFDDKVILGKSLNSLFFLVISSIYVFKYVHKDIPILIVSNPPYIGIVGLLVKLFKPSNFYFVFQDIFPESAVISKIIKSGGMVYLIFSFITYLICQKSEITITLSRSMKKLLETKYPDLNKSSIKVIENWSIEDIKILPKENNEFAIKHHLVDRFTLLYSGNIGRVHDIESIALASYLLKDKPINFVFIGDGYKKKILVYYQEKYKLKNIMLLPFQPRSILSQSLTACDISIVSLIEGAEKIIAPCKLYGMLASGRAILSISSSGSYIEEILHEYNCGINCPPHNPEQLAATITELAANPERVKEMGEKSRQLYEERYTFRRALDEYEKIIFGV